MKTTTRYLLLTAIAVGIAGAAHTTNAGDTKKKDTAVVQTPNGQCYQVRVPHDAATKNPDGTTTIHREALKKVEVKPIPCPKVNQTPTQKK